MNNLMRRLLFAYLLILSLIAFANVPFSVYDSPVQSEMVLAVTPDGHYLEASNKDAETFLEPVVQLHLLAASASNIQVLGAATAFSVSGSKKEGISYLLTNDHFCSNAILISADPTMSASVTYTKGLQKASMYFNPAGAAKILHSDPSTDMCLLEVSEYIPPVVFENYREIGPIIPVKVVGGPDGVFPIIIDTYISSMILRTELGITDMVGHGRDFIFLSGLIIPGSSGSPIFNKKERVVGIVFATPPSLQGGIAIQGEDIQDWLDTQGIKYKAI
jgi:S1-C subfamily serine protease